MANVFYEKDADRGVIASRKVAIVGYGSQGHAHAQNLRDSGVKVIVANRRDSANGRLAIEHGFDPMSVEDAVKQGDLIIITLPDEVQPELSLADALSVEHSPRQLDGRLLLDLDAAAVVHLDRDHPLNGCVGCRSPRREACTPRRSAAPACA